MRANIVTTPESSEFTFIKQRTDNYALSAGLILRKDEIIAVQPELSLTYFLEEGGHLQYQLSYH